VYRRNLQIFGDNLSKPIPVTARSKAWVCGRSTAGIVGSNPAGAWLSVSCYVLSRRDLCDKLITRPEGSYRLWYIWVRSWSLDNEKALAR